MKIWSLFFAGLMLIAPTVLCAEDEAFDADKYKERLAKLDADTLRIVAMQLRMRLEQQDAEIAQLKEQLAQAAGGSGTTSPDGSVAVVDDGRWIVTVSMVSDPSDDIADAEEKIEKLQQKLDGYLMKSGGRVEGIKDKLRAAQSEYAKAMSAKRWNGSSNDSRYSPAEIAEFRRNVASLERDQRNIEAQITRLKSEIEKMSNVRKIMGKTDDGVAVVVWARGIYADQVDAIEVGKKYEMIGAGKISGNTGEIRLKTATALADAAE